MVLTEQGQKNLQKIKGYEGIKEEIIERQKPIILMDEYEKEKKPCGGCPVHCKNN